MVLRFDARDEGWVADGGYCLTLCGFSCIFSVLILCGGIAQLVEQWNHNPWVGGSSPSAATKK